MHKIVNFATSSNIVLPKFLQKRTQTNPKKEWKLTYNYIWIDLIAERYGEVWSLPRRIGIKQREDYDELN